MTIRVAINGYGRIGRCLLRAIYEGGLSDQFEVVAINDLGSADISAHLTKYDTTHGRFNGDITLTENVMTVNNKQILMLAENDPSKYPWKKFDIDIVFECTGIFTSKEKCQGHLKAGAKRVLVSAPGGSDVDATIVYGVNHQILNNNMQVISNASCTTNCLAPIAQSLNSSIGICSGLMTTIHSYTNDQSLVDNYHKDLGRARAAAHNMIPTNTGAAVAVGLVLPELKGKLDGFAIRVPTMNVSVVDLTFISSRQTSPDEVNAVIKSSAENELQGVLEYCDRTLVSTDFNHDIHASIFDATQTRVTDNLVKVLSWYDNEWGFSNQMLKTARAWVKQYS